MNKVKVNIILHRSALVRYIKEMAYIISKASAAKAEDGIGTDYVIADILDKEADGGDGNYYLAVRSMNYAFTQCLSLVRKHIYEEQRESASCNAHGTPETYRITLLMETQHPTTIANILQEQMNRYMALSTLAEWSKLNASELTEIYLAEAETVREEIRHVINPPTKAKVKGWPLW